MRAQAEVADLFAGVRLLRYKLMPNELIEADRLQHARIRQLQERIARLEAGE